jgi:hypothetical protein
MLLIPAMDGRLIFFVMPEGFYPASSLLFARRDAGFRLYTLPE